MSLYTSSYEAEQIDYNMSKFFNSLNTVVVSTDSGSTVTMSKGNVSDDDYIVLNAKEENGKWTFHPMEFGTWVIKVLKNQQVAQQTLNINEIKIRNISITF